MQAATNVVAQVLERIVTMLAISGSMAAFASWKMPTHTAKVASERLVRSVRSAADVVAVRRLLERGHGRRAALLGMLAAGREATAGRRPSAAP